MKQDETDYEQRENDSGAYCVRSRTPHFLLFAIAFTPHKPHGYWVYRLLLRNCSRTMGTQGQLSTVSQQEQQAPLFGQTGRQTYAGRRK